uniref:Interleukin-12 subunit beta n=1 Tax=Pavo cristatus TaxID=9049 RepID=A0A8C9F4B4_PAVCR
MSSLLVTFILLILAGANMSFFAISEVYVIESEWNDETPAKKVKLTCNTADEALPVYWKKGTELKGTGKTLIAEVKEFPDAGNYTCLSAKTHEIISYSFFLITKVDSNGQMIRSILKSYKEPSKTFLKCEAKNYSGIFTCSWMTENESPSVKFTIRSLKGSQGDVTCSSPVARTDQSVTEYTTQCQKENYCPFAEEHQPTEMFLEVIDEVEYENYTSSFFIRDISEKPWLHEAALYHTSGLSSSSSLTVDILEEGTADSESWKCSLLHFFSCLWSTLHIIGS